MNMVVLAQNSDLLNEFIESYGFTIVSAIFTAIAGYIGVVIKKLCAKYLDNSTKQSVARTCVRAIEQLYKDIHGEDKLNKCIEAVVGMLGEKGISSTDLEIRMLIESAVQEFNKEFSDNKNTLKSEASDKGVS